MDKLVIPPNSNWFSQSNCYCTPDNGLIYGATSKVVYIPPKSENAEYGIKVLDLRKKVHCFALCPNFKETRRLAALNGDSQVIVYNFDTEEILKGHKGHSGAEEFGKQNQLSAITFTTGNVVLSSLNSDVIKFCLLTNTFKVYPDFSGRNAVTIMRTFPRNQNHVAAGTKNGLVLLIDGEKMEITSRLRGHDLEITSLDFMTFTCASKEKSGEKRLKRSKKAPPAVEEDGDIFDIYSSENIDNDEFGVYQENSRSDYGEAPPPPPLQEKVHNNSSFDFLEACSSLKDHILSNTDESMNASNSQSAAATKFEDNKEQYGVKNEDNISIDVSLLSNPSSHTPVLTEESLNYLDECQRMQDFEASNESNEMTVLASGSRESIVLLWNVVDYGVMHKIKWHPRPKSQHLLPATFTNVLWMNQETLLITDNNGEIIEHKIKFDPEMRSMSDQKQKREFDVKGALNICKSEDSSVLWVSSIHRHICCLETKEFSKIVSLDTLQYRIHNIIESPIDSNLIAIGGNDKRLCLWNTSETNHHLISLKPYMNKIQSGILCISWHPTKDNILAFSTREGRIGILDTNKSTNVPVILESFTTHEIYSMTWTKYTDASGNETGMLVACSNGKLVFYNYKDFKISFISQFKQVCSVAARENLLAIGTSTGVVYICDILNEYVVLAEEKVSRKYTGMITWYNDYLAIATETDVALSRVTIKSENGAFSSVNIEGKILRLHHSKRVYSIRFDKAGDHIVSTCSNGEIMVWDVGASPDPVVVAKMNIGTPAYCAIFLPNNEKIIVCGGQDSTIHSFEWGKYPYCMESAVTEKAQKHESKLKHMTWGVMSEVTTVSKRKNRRVKKKILPKPTGVSEIANELKTMKLSSKKNATLFHSAYREISVNPASYIEMLLNDSNGREPSMNEKLFGSRKDIKVMIDKELECDPSAMSALILPQMTDDLKQEILARIENKSLTEVHISVAPSVSYDLWRKCCMAFGNQCIENEDFFRAIPYLLAVNDVDTCINSLCDSKLFREAWVIAKMRKDEKDPIFEKIMQQWIAFYDCSGNYETAAALLCIKSEYRRAHELLNKRQNKDDKLTELINRLSSKF